MKNKAEIIDLIMTLIITIIIILTLSLVPNKSPIIATLKYLFVFFLCYIIRKPFGKIILSKFKN